jgi:hypothetical protein
LDGKFGHARWPPPPTTPTDYAEYVEADEDPECVKEDEDSKEDENDEFAEEDDEFADDVEDSEPTVEDWEAFRAFKRLEKQKNLSNSGRCRLSSHHLPSSSRCRRSSGRCLSSRHRRSSSCHRQSSSRHRSDKNVKVLYKQVLCLHLLSVCKIENAFFCLLNSVPSVTNDRDTKKLLKKWFGYVYQTWITNANWPISSWCQHYRKLRTNSDVEGWHTGLNVQCGRRQNGKGLPLLMLIDVLAKEAQLVELLEDEMLLQNHRLRVKRKTYASLNSKLFSLWDDHQKNILNTKTLLFNCAKLYSDFNSFKFSRNADDRREVELEV